MPSGVGRCAARLQDAGIRVVQTPYRAPNANAYAERFVRSIKEECLNRLIPFGERHLRRAVAEFVAHYHRERNHQGLDNELIERPACRKGVSVECGDTNVSVGCSTTTPEQREESSSRFRRWHGTLRPPEPTAAKSFDLGSGRE